MQPPTHFLDGALGAAAMLDGTVLFLPAEFASRVQFGWTISVHILFAALSIGLAPFIIYFTWKDIRTGSERYARLRSFWLKVFAAGFVMGTVTGIPMSFQFGTNFPGFSALAGELIGGPLAFEAKMAFFLEAVFLGVLLFGCEKVSDRTYFLSSVLTGFGAWLSGFWILVVNAWMQTPQGYEMITRNGMEVAKLTDPIAAFFTPRMTWMYVHMINASVISVALLVAGVAAYIVWKKRDAKAWHTALKIAVLLLIVAAPLQAVHGDAYGRHVEDTQPQKFAAMEAHYETGTADLHLFAIPTSPDAIMNPSEENLFAISLPRVGSFLASGGDFDAVVKGLDEYEQNPPVPLVFWSFRIMVGLGFLFIGLAFWGGYLIYRDRLSDSSLYLRAMIAASPLGYAALLTGWYVTEIGRQPWVVQDVLKTGEAVSSTLTSTEATLSLAAFVVIYIGLVVAALYTLRWLIEDELDELGAEPAPDDHWYGPIPGVTSDD